MKGDFEMKVNILFLDCPLQFSPATLTALNGALDILNRRLQHPVLLNLYLAPSGRSVHQVIALDIYRNRTTGPKLGLALVSSG